jgi:DNA-binding transcriptional MocR family regulator
MKLPLSTSLRFRLDLHSGVPVYRQIIGQVRRSMASGSPVAGDQLPIVRQLAFDLPINPNPFEQLQDSSQRQPEGDERSWRKSRLLPLTELQ